MSQWYVSIDGQQMGPYDEASFRGYIDSGRIAASHTVWREGMPEWKEASAVPELAPLFAISSHSTPSPAAGASKPQPVSSPPSSSTPPIHPAQMLTEAIQQHRAATGYSPTSPAHKGAIASLLLGIFSWVMFGPVTGIPAIIVGRKARKEIAENPQLTGRGLATTGIILGAMNIFFYALIIVVFIASALS